MALAGGTRSDASRSPCSWNTSSALTTGETRLSPPFPGRRWQRRPGAGLRCGRPLVRGECRPQRGRAAAAGGTLEPAGCRQRAGGAARRMGPAAGCPWPRNRGGWCRWGHDSRAEISAVRSRAAGPGRRGTGRARRRARRPRRRAERDPELAAASRRRGPAERARADAGRRRRGAWRSRGGAGRARRDLERALGREAGSSGGARAHDDPGQGAARR